MAGQKVLLVDVEPWVTDALRRILRKESFDVFVAGSADKAFGVLVEEEIDILVADEMMPGMPGLDFLRVVCSRYPNTIRIILTGNPNLDAALRALNQGHIYRFLTKPCTGSELALVIRQGIQKRSLSRIGQNLLVAAKRQNALLEELEGRYPGITSVKRDVGGAVEISEVQVDLEALIEEVKEEVRRSRSILKPLE